MYHQMIFLSDKHPGKWRLNNELLVFVMRSNEPLSIRWDCICTNWRYIHLTNGIVNSNHSNSTIHISKDFCTDTYVAVQQTAFLSLFELIFETFLANFFNQMNWSVCMHCLLLVQQQIRFKLIAWALTMS